MKEIVNLEKLNSYGYKLPANNPNYAVPNNITHAQLRYNDFTSSYVIQGSAVSGSNSTFEFTPTEFGCTVSGKTYSRFKLFTSDDGTNYSENKSYGGTYGKTLFEEGIFVCSVNFQNPIAGSLTVLTNTVYYNNAHVTATQGRDSLGLYYLLFSQNIITTNQANVIMDRITPSQDSGALLGYCINNPTDATAARLYFYTNNDSNVSADDVVLNHLVKIKFL